MKHLHVWLMVALTFVTGVLDAVGYLGLDRVFTGNMTGNVVILGMGLAAEDSLPVAGPLAALAGYAAGAALVGRLLTGHEKSWTTTVTAVLAANALVLTAIGAILLAGHIDGASLSGVAIAATMAALMGAQAAVARALAVTDMTTVVVTSTLTAYVGETLFSPGFGFFKHRRFWAIVAIFAGALFGALAMKVHISVPVFGAALLSALVAVVGARRWAG